MLDKFEEELVSFFDRGQDTTALASPEMVYQSCVPSSFQRLALHATCQWMDLMCKSMNLNFAIKIVNHSEY